MVCLDIHPYIVCTSSEGSGQSAQRNQIMSLIPDLYAVDYLQKNRRLSYIDGPQLSPCRAKEAQTSCAFAQPRLSIQCSHSQSMDLDKGSDPNFDL